MTGNDVHLIKINNIITHFLTVYDDESALSANDTVIAAVFIKSTLNEKLFDEKRKITGPLPSPDNQTLVQHSIERLCEERTLESIHNFIEKFSNLDSSRYRIEIPYDDITSFIYGYDGVISSEAVEERLDAFSNILSNQVKQLSEFDAIKVEKAYKKFVRHLKLAIGQKDYFVSINKKAKEASNLAEETANKALNIAGNAQRALDRANVTAKRAEEVSSNAQKLANDASNQVKETKKSSENMMVNYVTILGIFATIIITVFGGINIIGSTVKLLEGSNKLAYLVFVVSFLMICLLTLIRTLTTWISSLNNYREDKVIVGSPKSFYKTSVISFLTVVVVAGIISYFNKPQETSQNNDGKDKPNSSNVLFMNIEK